MRCINNKLAIFMASIFLITSISGCAGLSYGARYSISDTAEENNNQTYSTFSSDLCVVDSDINLSDIQLSETTSGGLFDLNNKETLYARNIHEQVHPASLTKVMTAYVALKYGQLDQMLVAGSDVYVTESGAQKINLKEGDRMTLDQALRILLIYSANDVANLIASNISGSIDEFVELMNREAVRLGATNAHFANPHGLTEEGHYVTAYDMYLIFNAAMQYDIFSEIINTTEYSTSFYDINGGTKDISVSNTNAYLRGDELPPSGVTVIGGKTGTTQAAGHCLILLARDTGGNPYISVIMRDTDSGTLYNDMTELLTEIVN